MICEASSEDDEQQKEIKIQQMHHPFIFPTVTPRVLRFVCNGKKVRTETEKKTRRTESHQIAHHLHSRWLDLKFISCNFFKNL